MSLAVTILTGARPTLLAKTLDSLRAFHGPLLDHAYVLALHNGGDLETEAILARNSDLFNGVMTTPTLLGIGEAASMLFTEAQRRGEYLLHVEDDWEAGPGDWYPQAKALLEAGAFQVRLRRYNEPVLVQHMVTKKRIVWEKSPDAHFTDDAHYTLNPSLIRTSDIAKAWPAKGERDAQNRLWRRNRRRVAQLVPGIFRHIGGEDSLRKRVEKSGVKV